jgi:dihydroorotate dehydrogenase (fumarate)
MTIDLCGMQLEHPVMNAGGTAKSLEELRALFNSAASARVIGSQTGVKATTGNPQPNEFLDPAGVYMLNSKGLPDLGVGYYARDDISQALFDLTTDTVGAPVILSLAPKGGHADMDALLKLAHIWSVNALELNLSCPNVWDASGNQQQLACFNPLAVRESVSALADFLRQYQTDDWPVGLKVSPYSDPVQLKQIAQVIIDLSRQPGMPRLYVVTSNTFPNALALRPDGQSEISVRYGGMSGPALKPIALGQVSQWAEALHPMNIPVVGVGGISSGQDVADYLAAGAVAVQVGTHFWNRGARVFEEIVAEWVALP